VDSLTLRELRNRGGRAVERVLAGESVIVTRAGTPVAELRPIERPRIDRETLLARWRRLPRVDARALRRDLDRALDTSL
jgi:prevent-host-death family protein